MDKIIVEIQNGTVVTVWSSNPDVKVEVVDWDTAKYDDWIYLLADDDDEYQNLIRGLYQVLS